MAARSAGLQDALAIAEIYNHFIEHTLITFEEVVISERDVKVRLEQVAELGLPWLVWEDVNANGELQIFGYAYAGKFRERASYRFTVETAIYLAPQAAGRGIGGLLYRRLLDELRSKQLHRAVAGIALPNPVSVKLHEQLGFRRVGTFSEVGRKFEQWIDVGFWELDLTHPALGGSVV